MNKSDITRDYCMLKGPLGKQGYDWWWHSFTAHHKQTGQPKTFYIEYFLCNPAPAQPEPVIVWNDPQGRKALGYLLDAYAVVGDFPLLHQLVHPGKEAVLVVDGGGRTVKEH